MPADHQLAVTEHLPVDPDPSPARWSCWSTARSTGPAVSPGSPAASPNCTPWPTTDSGYHRSRDVVPVHTSLTGHMDDLLAVIDGRPVGRRRPQLRRHHRPRRRAPSGSAVTDPGRRRLRAAAAVARRRGPPATGPATGHEPRPRRRGSRRRRRAVLPADGGRLGLGPAPRRHEGGPTGRRGGTGRRARRHPHHRSPVRHRRRWPSPRCSAGDPHRSPTTGMRWPGSHTHVPGSDLVEFEGAGHGAHLTHPDAFARVRPCRRPVAPAPDATAHVRPGG